jgi:hypothetical protein
VNKDVSSYTGDLTEHMAEPVEMEAPAVPGVAVAAGNAVHVKLAAFWPQNPALWFAQAECQFQVKGVTGQFDRYCHVVSALPHESLRLVADQVEAPPSETAFDDIKQRLVASHQLSDFQKAEKLFLMQPLGSRKPSEMMAAMLEFCPRGEEKTNLFACLFLQRLPREIRVLLARVDHKDPKALAQQADELWALHDGRADSVAAVQPDFGEGELVAALRFGDRGRGGVNHGGRSRGGGGRARDGGRTSSAAVEEPEVSREARLAAGLSIKHWRYGEAASSCSQPCSWQGNGGAGGN